MSDWKYTFERIQKTTWLAQIAKDLYPRTMDSMPSEWWPGETVMPFRHPDDRYDSIRLPDSLFMQPARVMEWIDTSSDDAKSINRRVLNALNFGAQSIVLHVDEEKKYRCACGSMVFFLK